MHLRWVKRMVPLRCHDPLNEPPDALSPSATGDPPKISTFFNVPFAKNARNRLSGDQNGPSAPSVPVTSLALSESSARTQSRDSSPARDAKKASQRPSGETERNEADALKLVPSGGATTNRYTAAVLGSGALRRIAIVRLALTSASNPATPATAHVQQGDFASGMLERSGSGAAMTDASGIA